MKTFNSVLSAVVVSVLGLSATLSAPQALALDGKNYPGYMCKQFGGTGWSQTAYSSIYNGAAQPSAWILVECPVIKDVIGNSISHGWLKVTDRHYSDNIRCRLWSVSRDPNDSTASYSFHAASSSGSEPGVKTLNFGSLAAVPYGHYFYDCAIPPKYNDGTSNGGYSELHTYSVIENGSGD